MARILSIETSTTVTSAALHHEGKLLAFEINHTPNTAASLLAVMIDKILKEHPDKLDAVAVSSGPGSYTGLRIGVATAKGICYALSVPLISINSLMIMALQARSELTATHPAPAYRTGRPGTQHLYCPMIDARRMEVYTMLFNEKLDVIETTSARIIDASSYAEILNYKKVYFFGNGAEKCKSTIIHPNAVFVDNIFPSAEWMGELAFASYKEKRFEDVADFEPLYLKDFIAKKPKSLV